MDLVIIPQALLVFYGFLVLGCGSALGFIVARNAKRLISQPDPPRLIERRVDVVEQELEDTRADLARLMEESSFLRELRAPQRDREDGTQRFVA